MYILKPSGKFTYICPWQQRIIRKRGNIKRENMFDLKYILRGEGVSVPGQLRWNKDYVILYNM